MGNKQSGPKGTTFIVRGQQVVLRRKQGWEKQYKKPPTRGTRQQGNKASTTWLGDDTRGNNNHGATAAMHLRKSYALVKYKAGIAGGYSGSFLIVWLCLMVAFLPLWTWFCTYFITHWGGPSRENTEELRVLDGADTRVWASVCGRLRYVLIELKTDMSVIGVESSKKDVCANDEVFD